MDDFAEVAHQCVDKVIHGLLFNVPDLLGEKVVGEDVWKFLLQYFLSGIWKSPGVKASSVGGQVHEQRSECVVLNDRTATAVLKTFLGS